MKGMKGSYGGKSGMKDMKAMKGGKAATGKNTGSKPTGAVKKANGKRGC